ncbi:Arc family DNA-binding protein [uncultured Psychrobacter sp.]|uniref:Arc family DNA-binding protein n=1 Tax=uncultured Psychrobacter sp. TaxID=259303 RepID=UPI0025977B82|nr:Arc family DNA-binding protein [uncultured Psychrobacter sp.]
MTIQTEPQYKLRMPHELRDKIKSSAEKKNRSMNADIVARLEQTFKEEESTTPSTSNVLIVTAVYQTLREEGYTHEKAEQVITDSVKKLLDMDFIKKNFNNAIDTDKD